MGDQITAVENCPLSWDPTPKDSDRNLCTEHEVQFMSFPGSFHQVVNGWMILQAFGGAVRNSGCIHPSVVEQRKIILCQRMARPWMTKIYSTSAW